LEALPLWLAGIAFDCDPQLDAIFHAFDASLKADACRRQQLRVGFFGSRRYS